MKIQRDKRGRIAAPPTFADAPPAQSAAEKRDATKLKAAMTRFQTAHGMDALIVLLKAELATRGEDRARLDMMAPKLAADGQQSILDAGR